MNKPIIILGIDPGTAITGWGVIEKKLINRKGNKKEHRDLISSKSLTLVNYGCIVTAKEEIMPLRLLRIRRELIKILDKYKPNYVAIEQLFFGANSRTAMFVGQAKGAILTTAAEYGMNIFEYQGLSVKKVLSGNGHAEKKLIAKLVKKILKMKEIPKPDDAADALSIAICHSSRLDE